MEYWSHQSFIPQVRLYLADLDMEFKVLLIMDNAGDHTLNLYHKGVQLKFLPPNTTSLLQTMDQGMIHAFKAFYTRNSLQHLVDAMDHDSEFTLKAYWRNFTIATCLSVIDRLLKDMKKETLNACWSKFWLDCVHNYTGFSPQKIQHSAINKVFQLARILSCQGFDDITEDDVCTLIDARSDPLTDQDLENLTKSASEEEDTSGSGEEQEQEEAA
ncbi:tigger transposable element-derived protein 1-like [Macrobrachium nipponense]|uniref:tigger transposable element-derived protein 1-like n=1 Tax=Macrobrachium nipponense TaxID=159736 RepID=UPI0030C80BB0